MREESSILVLELHLRYLIAYIFSETNRRLLLANLARGLFFFNHNCVNVMFFVGERKKVQYTGITYFSLMIMCFSNPLTSCVLLVFEFNFFT
jgi:hypothetical protein